jgi:hypothetical protein
VTGMGQNLPVQPRNVHDRNATADSMGRGNTF